MRRLLLLRHADSDRPAGVGDHERPLSPQGRADSALIGRQIAQLDLLPELAIVSTAQRAQETWGLVQPHLAVSVVQRDEPRVYNASTQTLLAVIGETEPNVDSLVMVGHNRRFINWRPNWRRQRMTTPGAGCATSCRRQDWR